jgi:hypothetical protein
VAGSRREYLAADKLKIYITVKLSSVAQACRGPDPDDRPKFNVAIIHEDNAAGKSILRSWNRCDTCPLAKACCEMSRRDGAIVAWHEVPGTGAPESTHQQKGESPFRTGTLACP